jgi:hypothetical protein
LNTLLLAEAVAVALGVAAAEAAVFVHLYKGGHLVEELRQNLDLQLLLQIIVL